MAVKTYSKGSNTSLSANLKVSEFACKGNGCCSTVLIDDQLVTYIQKIRDHFKKPITITSGYRCATHNARVGGATGSRHNKGQAADIVVQGVAPKKVAQYAESIGIMGIGLYETNQDGHFVHIDTRTTKSFWYGQAQAYRSTFGTYTASTSTSTSSTVNTSNNTSGSYAQKTFVTDIQKVFGTMVDGIAGPLTLDKTITISEKTNARHSVVKLVQRRLLALGYSEVGSADGVAGPKFTEAVKRFQKDNGCAADGEITAGNKTWKKLLGMS